MIDPDTGLPYLNELVQDVRTQKKWVYAYGSSFEIKDELKSRGYMWDASKRVWKILVALSNEDEEEFLRSHPRGGQPLSENVAFSSTFKEAGS